MEQFIAILLWVLIFKFVLYPLANLVWKQLFGE